MNLTKAVGFLICLFFIVGSSSAQSNSSTTEAELKPDSSLSDKDKDTAANLNEARRALLYGIDSTVLSVINQSTSSKDKRLSDEIEKQFDSLNPDVQRAAIEYFIAVEDFRPHKHVEEMLINYIDFQAPVIQSLLRFLQTEKKTASADLMKNLLEITDSSKPELQASAVDTIVVCGSADQLPTLLALFKKTGTATVVRSSLIKAFGVFKTDQTFDLLKDIVEDKGEEKTLRYDALSALGQHGRADSLSTITKSLLSTDVFERGAAISSLGGFQLAKVLPQYQQALRDSYWRNRVAVLKVISDKKLLGLLEPVIYVAEKDPERPVQIAAYRTLAELNQEAGWQLMVDQFKNDKTAAEIRGTITEILVTKHFGPSHGVIREVMQAEWAKDKSWILGIICRELSHLKDAGAADLYDKMLEHPDYEIRIMGIRGIKENNLVLLKPKLETMLKNHPVAPLKASLEDALR